MTSFLWDSIKSVADKVGEVTAQASYKTKVNAELILIDRELKGRQQTFGVELYAYAQELSKEPSFYASDDLLTATLRPPLLKAQREIAALHNKKVKQKTNLETAKAQRAAISTGTTWQEKVVSTAKTTAMAGGEVKLHTELTLMENEMTHYKYIFGEELYVEFQRLEDEKGWLPTDREIRSIYDQCRRDIEKIQKRRVTKEEELATIGGGAAATTGGFEPPPATTPTPYPNPSVAQPYAAETPSVAAPPSFHDSSSSANPSVQMTPAVSSFGAPAPAVSSFGAPAPAVSSFGAPAPTPASGLFGAPPPAAAATQSYGAFASPSASSSSSAQGYSSTGYSKPMGYSAPKVVVPAPAPVSSSNWMNQPDPFGTSNNNTTSVQSMPPPAQQQLSAMPYDPFAAAPQPTMQPQTQQQQQGNLFSPTPAAATGNQPPSMYDDPFAGLSNFQ